jgi:hypothetical protein
LFLDQGTSIPFKSRFMFSLHQIVLAVCGKGFASPVALMMSILGSSFY